MLQRLQTIVTEQKVKRFDKELTNQYDAQMKLLQEETMGPLAVAMQVQEFEKEVDKTLNILSTFTLSKSLLAQGYSYLTRGRSAYQIAKINQYKADIASLNNSMTIQSNMQLQKKAIKSTSEQYADGIIKHEVMDKHNLNQLQGIADHTKQKIGSKLTRLAFNDNIYQNQRISQLNRISNQSLRNQANRTMREEYRNRNKYAVEMGAKYGVQAAAFLASAGYSEVASTIGYLMNSRTEDENIDIVEGRVEEAKQDQVRQQNLQGVDQEQDEDEEEKQDTRRVTRSMSRKKQEEQRISQIDQNRRPLLMEALGLVPADEEDPEYPDQGQRQAGQSRKEMRRVVNQRRKEQEQEQGQGQGQGQAPIEPKQMPKKEENVLANQQERQNILRQKKYENRVRKGLQKAEKTFIAVKNLQRPLRMVKEKTYSLIQKQTQGSSRQIRKERKIMKAQITQDPSMQQFKNEMAKESYLTRSKAMQKTANIFRGTKANLTQASKLYKSLAFQNLRIVKTKQMVEMQYQRARAQKRMQPGIGKVFNGFIKSGSEQQTFLNKSRIDTDGILASRQFNKKVDPRADIQNYLIKNKVTLKKAIERGIERKRTRTIFLDFMRENEEYRQAMNLLQISKLPQGLRQQYMQKHKKREIKAFEKNKLDYNGLFPIQESIQQLRVEMSKVPAVRIQKATFMIQNQDWIKDNAVIQSQTLARQICENPKFEL